MSQHILLRLPPCWPHGLTGPPRPPSHLQPWQGLRNFTHTMPTAPSMPAAPFQVSLPSPGRWKIFKTCIRQPHSPGKEPSEAPTAWSPSSSVLQRAVALLAPGDPTRTHSEGLAMGLAGPRAHAVPSPFTTPFHPVADPSSSRASLGHRTTGSSSGDPPPSHIGASNAHCLFTLRLSSHCADPAGWEWRVSLWATWSAGSLTRCPLLRLRRIQTSLCARRLTPP